MDPKLIGSIERLLTIYVTYLVTKYGAGLGFNAADVVVILMSGLSAAWGVYSNRKAAIIATASNLDEVKKVELENTPEGRALSQSTPANVTVTVGASNV